MEYYYQLLEQITSGTDSSLILFFVIVAAMVLPLYAIMLKDRKNYREHENQKQNKYIEREREIIAVIKENSSVIAENAAITSGLKSLFKDNELELKQAVNRIHQRVDMLLVENAETKATVNAIFAAFNNANQNKTPQNRTKAKTR